MGDLRYAKLWGGIGAIMTLVGIGFVGFILKIVGVKYIADSIDNQSTFRKYIVAAVLWIVGLIVLSKPVIRVIKAGHVGFSTVGSSFFVAAVIIVIGAWFLKTSYDVISDETEVGYFHTAGRLYLISAILTFVIIGLIIVLIAAIVEAVAFFSLPDSLPERGNTKESAIDEFRVEVAPSSKDPPE